MELFPNCSKGSDSSQCSSTAKALEYLDFAISLTTNAKRNILTCDWTDKQYTDCLEILQSGQNKSGIYTVWPKSRTFPANHTVEVYCDMDTDGGGWTVIQRRGNYEKQEDFSRNWKDYKTGFGQCSEDFWLGNDNIFALSNQGKYKIRFDMEDAKGAEGYAVYDTFYIDDESTGYMLHISGYTGNVGDSMKLHNLSTFSTKDKDLQNKLWCSQKYRGGWWYEKSLCFGVNANGVYERYGKTHQNVVWENWRPEQNLDKLEIKIRRKL